MLRRAEPEIYCGKQSCKISQTHRQKGESEDKGKERRDIAAVLMVHSKETHQERGVPQSINIYRVKAVTSFLTAGIPMKKFPASDLFWRKVDIDLLIRVTWQILSCLKINFG